MKKKRKRDVKMKEKRK